MRLFTRIVLVPVMALLLVASTGAANANRHRPKVNPWASYFPAQGVSCVMNVSRDGVLRGQTKTTVRAKSPRRVVIHAHGGSNRGYQFIPGKRLRSVRSVFDNSDGYRSRLIQVMTLPSPFALAHRRAGRQTSTITMTMPYRVAHALLVRGRTMRAVGTYRASGLGARMINLADGESTAVRAVGYRIALRSVTLSNVKPAYRSRIKRILRPAFAKGQYTDWMAQGLGEVLIQQRTPQGVLWTARTVECGRRLKTARATSAGGTRPVADRHEMGSIGVDSLIQQLSRATR